MDTDPAVANHVFAHDLLARLAAAGVRHACLGPGSRSTPLALAAAAVDDITVHIHHDERVASFVALGIAKATGHPVVVISTSGTAAVEFAPAMTEAFYSHTPLIALTADRPPELQNVGAPQTIDQHRLYGTHAKWSHTAAPPVAGAASAAGLAELMMVAALSPPPGPVHLNVPFREPLAPPVGFAYPDLPSTQPVVAAERHPTPGELSALADHLIGRRTLFVVGAVSSDPAPIGHLAVDVGAAVFADVTSPLRSTAVPTTLIAAGDALAGAGALDTDPPEVVVRWGGVPTSKPIWSWLDGHAEVDQIVVDDANRIGGGAGSRLVVNADPGATAQTLVGEGIVGDKAFTERWLERDEAAREAVLGNLGSFPTEPLVAHVVATASHDGTRVFAGSSMPIRDLDLVALDPDKTPVCFGNRGAAGIDGSIATALGAAVAGPVVALIGDVAALYDLGGMAAAAASDRDVTIVVVHNDGGGIFSFLPQADPSRIDPTQFETLFGTPHGTDFVAIAGALGMTGLDITSGEELSERLGHSGPQLLQVRTDRTTNVAVHHQIRTAVRNAIGG